MFSGEHFNANFFYHSNCNIDHAFLLLEEHEKTIFVPKMNSLLAKETFNGNVVIYEDVYKELEKRLKDKKVYVDGASLSLRLFNRLSIFCKPIDYSQELLLLRRTKSKDEVAKISKAVWITKEILAGLEITSEKTEYQLKKEILNAMYDRGLKPAFDPIIASGKNSAHVHARSGDRKLSGIVMIDLGVRYEEYCSDITRCYFLDDEVKPKKMYKQLQDITETIVESLPNYETGDQVHEFVQQLIKREGLPELPHNIGHGVGLDVHEFPRFSKKFKDPIPESTFTIEPGVYFSDFGLRYEETVYHNGTKARVL